jgi:hypothetical protein
VFERVVPKPVTALAVGKPPKVALLSEGEVWIGDGRSPFVRAPAPDSHEPGVSIELFFGRDDQPRLMGSRQRGAKLEPYYRRFKGGRFQPEPSELGPLAGPGGVLYGVLGHADPEVVCRPAQFCLVKRTTGWSRAAAHAEPVRVVLAGGTGFALHRERIERLEGERWVALAPERTFAEPVSLFADGAGGLYVVEAGREVLVRLTGGRWESFETPVRGPRVISGTGANDLWLAGRSGAAHFDGRTWASVPGISGPLSFVALAGESVWLAGDAGAFLGSPARQ